MGLRFPLLALAIGFLACGGKRAPVSYTDGKLRVEIRGRRIHEVADGVYDFTLIVTGTRPPGPVCVTTILKNRGAVGGTSVRNSCGGGILAWYSGKLNFTRELYRVLSGMPTRFEDPNETFTTLIPGFQDAAEDEDVKIDLIVEIHPAEPHPETGELVPLPRVLARCSFCIRLTCRDCEFVA